MKIFNLGLEEKDNVVDTSQSVMQPPQIILPEEKSDAISNDMTLPQSGNAPQNSDTLPQSGNTSQKDTTLPQTEKSVKKPKKINRQKGTRYPQGRAYPYYGTYYGAGGYKGGVFKPEQFFTKAKVTIILIENTAEVAKEKDKLEKIIKSLVTTGQVCVISYGSAVRKTEMVEANSFNCSSLLCQGDIGDKACLFDALVVLESLVSKLPEELKKKKLKIDGIDIIGIGRCIDKYSLASKEIGIESFNKVASKNDVVTKYFCLSEEYFVEAATIGFHSIGAINRNYM